MDLDPPALHNLPSVLSGHPSAGEVRPPEPVARRYARARALSGAAAVAVILLGCSVLAGWLLGNPTLKSGIPGLVAMNPATALAFVLAGASLLTLHHGAGAQSRRVVARVSAALVILVALLCLSRLYTPWDLRPDRLLLVISVMVMPEMSGLQLRQRVREVRPTLPVLLMSGYTEEAITRLGGPEPIPAVIEKPFTAQGMLAQVKHLLTAEVSDA